MPRDSQPMRLVAFPTSPLSSTALELQVLQVSSLFTPLPLQKNTSVADVLTAACIWTFGLIRSAHLLTRSAAGTVTPPTTLGARHASASRGMLNLLAICSSRSLVMSTWSTAWMLAFVHC